MTIRYLDLVNGNDANDGSTFALRKKTLNSATYNSGDTVRVMASPDPTSLGQSATFTNGSDTITLASAVTANIDTCENAWTASANVTSTVSSSNFREGTGGALQLDGVFEHQYAVAGDSDLGEQGVRQRRLAGAGAAGDQDVLPLAHGMAQELGLWGGQDTVGHVTIQADDVHGPLAQREGRPRCSGRQDALEAFARLWQLGSQERLAAMNFCTNVRRDQPDDPLAVRLGQLHT